MSNITLGVGGNAHFLFFHLTTCILRSSCSFSDPDLTPVWRFAACHPLSFLCLSTRSLTVYLNNAEIFKNQSGQNTLERLLVLGLVLKENSDG